MHGNITYHEFIQDLANNKQSDETYELTKNNCHLLDLVQEQIMLKRRNSHNFESSTKSVADMKKYVHVERISNTVLALGIPS